MCVCVPVYACVIHFLRQDNFTAHSQLCVILALFTWSIRTLSTTYIARHCVLIISSSVLFVCNYIVDYSQNGFFVLRYFHLNIWTTPFDKSSLNCTNFWVWPIPHAQTGNTLFQNRCLYALNSFHVYIN